MDIEELGTTVASTTTVGAGLLWLFREKVSAWVRGLTGARLKSMEDRMSKLEKDHANHEGELMRIAESMERTSDNMSQSFTRLTTAIEKIVDKHEETAMAVARIEGALERRSHPRQ